MHQLWAQKHLIFQQQKQLNKCPCLFVNNIMKSLKKEHGTASLKNYLHLDLDFCIFLLNCHCLTNLFWDIWFSYFEMP